MVNYADGKIYKLVNNVDDKIYIGSTCGTLRLRKSKHKSELKNKKYPNRNVYKHLKEVGWENVEIILIENYECKCKDELHARERYWIDELKPELNKCRTTITDVERKEYYRQKFNCECGGKYRKDNKTNHEKTKKHLKYIENQNN